MDMESVNDIYYEPNADIFISAHDWELNINMTVTDCAPTLQVFQSEYPQNWKVYTPDELRHIANRIRHDYADTLDDIADLWEQHNQGDAPQPEISDAIRKYAADNDIPLHLVQERADIPEEEFNARISNREPWSHDQLVAVSHALGIDVHTLRNFAIQLRRNNA